MTSAAKDAAALRAIADGLMEARGLARTRPDEVRASVKRLSLDITRLLILASPEECLRILQILGDGVERIRVAPLILEGYLYAAARLLQGIAARIEGEVADV